MKKSEEKFDISELINSREFKDFCTIVWELTGIVTALGSPEGKGFIASPKKAQFNSICKIIQSSPAGLRACKTCDRMNIGLAMTRKKGRHYICHAGLVDFVVPIYIDGKYVAFISCGQILPSRPTKSGFEKLCKRTNGLSIDLKKLKKAYFKSPYQTPKKVEATLKLLSSFANLFCEMGHRLHSAHKGNIPTLIFKAKNYISENFRDELSRAEVAEYLGISESYFSRLFAKTTGMTYIKFLNKLRLNEAKKLLAGTKWSVLKIAMEVGFGNVQYFNRLFQKMEYCSPTVYRKRCELHLSSDN